MTFRIAHVNVARSYRGGERQTELLIRELAGFDLEQVLVARRAAPLTKRLGDVDVELLEVSGHLPGVVRALSGSDLVHVHEGRSVYAAYLKSLLSGTPYIVTRRVPNAIGEHGFAHRAYRGAASVAAVSPQVADIVAAFDPAIELDVVPDCSSELAVDAAVVEAIRDRHRGRYLVGNVGALGRQKAQDQTIEAARALSHTHPDIHFLLVGSGEDEAALKAGAAGLENVEFTGFVENVGDYLAAFDLFILPSRWEGLGSILLDAMAQALPIVASRVGGVPFVVHDGETGRLIDPERPDQLAEAILELYTDPARARELGLRGREFAKGFTPRVMCDKYVALYSSVLGPIDERRE